MGLFNLFGGDKSSSASTVNTPTTSGNAPAIVGSNNKTVVNATSDNAIKAITTNTTSAFNFGARALDTVDRSVQNAIDAANQSAADAIASNSKVTANAIASNSQVIGNAIASNNQATSNAIASNNQATSNAMALTQSAIGTVASSMYDALGYTSHITDIAMQQTKLTDQTASDAISQVAQAYESAKSLQVNAGTVDNKYLIAVGMIVVGLFAVKVWGKA
jgi:cell division septum initiation protein DivIVA